MDFEDVLVMLGFMIGIIFLMSILGGCSSTQELDRAYTAQENVVRLQAQRQQPKSLVIDCAKGCGKVKVEFIHHKDMQQVTVPRIRTTNDVIVESAPHVTNALKWIGGFWAASDIVGNIADSAGDNNTITNVHNNNTGENAQSTNTLDVSKSNVTERNNNRRDSSDGNTSNDNDNDNDVSTVTTTTNTTETRTDTSTHTEDNDSTHTEDNDSTTTEVLEDVR